MSKAVLKMRRTMLFAALLAACLAAFPNPVSPANSDPLAALIARARAALGPGLTSVRSTYITGTVKAAGIRGAFQSWTDRSNGRYLMITDLGPLSSAEGYDGSGAWYRDAKGIVLPQTGPASRARSAGEVSSNSGAVFKSDHGGATLSYLGTRTESGKTYEAVEVRVPDGYPEEDWYDSATALLARRRVTMDLQSIVTDFSDYQNADGLMIAHQLLISYHSGLTQPVTITQVRTDIPDLAEHLRRPVSAANDFSVTGGQTIIPFKYVDHQIVVDVYINGKGPFRFNFDTGGGNLIDPTVAWAVGARTFGTGIPSGGIGKGTSLVQLAQVSQLSIGGATLRDQYFHVAKIERPFGTGFQGFTFPPGPQGLIGWEVLARFVTTIDYASGKIILRTPVATAGAPADQTSIPLLFDRSSPEFACRIGGVDATCLVDTGSWWSVTVTSPFSRNHQGVAPRFMDESGYTGSGLRGPSGGVSGPLGSFQIGPITLTNVDAQFSYDQEGLLANRYLAAIVGNQVWNRFNLTLDYARATMNLSPNPAFDGQ